ncbi:MAG TPA: tRNA (adenosine(37)-N6)-threonylcarbamoyltransferase complex ATPase subunit type 1 TsaE [Candidatus Ornithomonoglobus merdipullorum]|uniref:tRNA threonylcarbamoyladenosine biosynthesis protein TsaE n=1 Tax=Candidatus Ornithomonoglobus merdipullorum TaxID=2840895 RepID=A0A9D1MCD5_9FIRM|nr:tRNA (adenosine(37)-N6)-threonylcarbamoyltransferase complex ATPase subunit type 1 TsaE [Candidatus Ornithomonoglobus merdipullorum]
MKYITNSYEETERVAAELAKSLKGGEVIAMYGDLGAGKTAFVRGLARALGIEGHITSPTFTIMNAYNGRLPLYHFDVYRIADPDEMYEIGCDEYIGSDGVCVIEWAELIEDILPDEYIKVNIKKDSEKGDDYREITIENAGLSKE